MNDKRPSRRRIVGIGSLIFTLILASLSLASVPAGAQSAPTTRGGGQCPVLSVANPSPGNDLIAGSVILSGSAFDPAATQGAGITRVDLFLGQREQGGTFLGSAVPGTVPGQAPDAYSVEVTVPALNRGVDFAAYAISSVTGQETTVTFPIFVGTPTRTSVTPTPIPTTMNVTSTCPNGVASASAPASNAAAGAPTTMASAPGASTTTSTSATTTATNGCPVLSIGNPSPGSDIIPGGYVISGEAWDPAATQGAGVTRVDLFLGARDQGGTILGSAVPGQDTSNPSNPRAFSVEVQVPKTLNRGLDFAAYAISSVTGQETAVTFPVFVGVPTVTTGATPTPVPTTETVTNTCGR